MFGTQIVASGRLVVYAALLGAAVGVSAGIYGTHKIMGYAEQKAQIAELQADRFQLQEKIKAQATVLEEDSGQAQANAKSLEEMKGQLSELLSKISRGVALPADDVERLRELWGKSAGSPEKRRAKGLSGISAR